MYHMIISTAKTRQGKKQKTLPGVVKTDSATETRDNLRDSAKAKFKWLSFRAFLQKYS